MAGAKPIRHSKHYQLARMYCSVLAADLSEAMLAGTHNKSARPIRGPPFLQLFRASNSCPCRNAATKLRSKLQSSWSRSRSVSISRAATEVPRRLPVALPVANHRPLLPKHPAYASRLAEGLLGVSGSVSLASCPWHRGSSLEPVRDERGSGVTSRWHICRHVESVPPRGSPIPQRKTRAPFSELLPPRREQPRCLTPVQSRTPCPIALAEHATPSSPTALARIGLVQA